MTVRLRYFAWVREMIGHDTEEWPLEAPMTVAALVEQLAAASPEHARALGERGRIRAAVNEEFAVWDAQVRPGDEVALFPPVTGG